MRILIVAVIMLFAAASLPALAQPDLPGQGGAGLGRNRPQNPPPKDDSNKKGDEGQQQSGQQQSGERKKKKDDR